MDDIETQKAVFVFNAVNDGWSVVKRNGAYIFTKKHENKKEVLSEEYLKKFLIKNLRG